MIRAQMIYELAQNCKEAEWLARDGFGYPSKKEAEDALAKDGLIDPYYRSLLKVYAIETPK